MNEPLPDQENTWKPKDPIGKVLHMLCLLMAVSGSLLFSVMVVTIMVSIIGRKLFNWAVPGDVELLQMAAACASASFFAYCHLSRSDVKVDFFTANLSARKVSFLDFLGSLCVAAVGVLLCWRTAVGAEQLYEVGETSPILDWPVWVAQALMVPGFFLLILAGLYTAVQHLNAAREK